MSRPPTPFLPEQPEAEASEATRAIYAQIRRLSGVPMVALIFRHLATLPGGMDWAWAVIGPPLAQGQLQERAWAMAEALDLAPERPVRAEALHELGIDEAALREMARLSLAYARANPVNLLALRLIALRLRGEDALSPSPARLTESSGLADSSGPPSTSSPLAPGSATSVWQPPAPVGPLLPMIDLHSAPPELMALLQGLSQRGQVPEQAFVPSYYRQLASRPPLLTLASRLVPPAFGRIDAAAARLREQASAHAAELAAIGPAHPPCPEGLRQPMLAAVDVFTERIPEMIAVVALLRKALNLQDLED